MSLPWRVEHASVEMSLSPLNTRGQYALRAFRGPGAGGRGPGAGGRGPGDTGQGPGAGGREPGAGGRGPFYFEKVYVVST